MGMFPGSKLTERAEKGNFTSATELEVLLQLREILENLDVDNMMFYLDYSLNTASLKGIFSKDKKVVLDRINYLIKTVDKKPLIRLCSWQMSSNI